MHGTWVLIIILAISSLPVIAVYIWYKLAKYPVSPEKYLVTLLVGATAVFPALLFQILLPVNKSHMFYHYFVYIASTEEISRLLILIIYLSIVSSIIKTKDDNNLLSWNTVKLGTALGLAAGLGFAILENAGYALYYNMDIKLLLLRAVTSAPMHAACGSRAGAAAVMFRTNPVQAVFRFITAIAIHGLYNLILDLAGAPPPLIFIMAILIAFSALTTAILSIRGSWNETEAV